MSESTAVSRLVSCVENLTTEEDHPYESGKNMESL